MDSEYLHAYKNGTDILIQKHKSIPCTRIPIYNSAHSRIEPRRTSPELPSP